MYVISQITVLDEDKELYETHIGIDNKEKTLLLSAWGKTANESRLNAVSCAWRLALKLSEDMMEKQIKQYPLTEKDMIRPDESPKR